MNTVKRKVWIVTYLLKDTDPETGEELNWLSPQQRAYADTYLEAEEMRRKLLAGEDEYYGNLVEDCEISDDLKEVEFFI